MKLTLSLITAVILAPLATLDAACSPERISLDQGWCFDLGDIPMPVLNTHKEN